MSEINTVRINESSVYTPLDNGETIVLNLNTKNYFSLNESGSFVWELIQEGLSLDQMTIRLTEFYEVDAETAAVCVKSLIADLMKQELVLPAMH